MITTPRKPIVSATDPDFVRDLKGCILWIFDELQRLEVQGDQITTYATQGVSGKVLHAVENAVESGPRWAKITVDNADGTYDAKEQERDTAAWADKSGGLEWLDSEGTALEEQTAFQGVPVDTVVAVWQRSEDGSWIFDWPVIAYLQSLGGHVLANDQALVHLAGAVPTWVDLEEFECPT